MGGRRRIASVGLAIALACLALGCTTDKPKGPPFARLADPDVGSTLIYIYRLDALRGMGIANVQLNGDGLVDLKNTEYVSFLLDPGEYDLRARLRWLGIVPRSWNGIEFKARGGETLYLRIWAAYQEVPDVGPKMDPARSDTKPEVGLHLALIPPEEAKVELPAMRRAQLD